jgi:hypothetical protein
MSHINHGWNEASVSGIFKPMVVYTPARAAKNPPKLKLFLNLSGCRELPDEIRKFFLIN